MPDRARVDSPTEARNERTADLDLVGTRDLLGLLNAEDATVPAAVAGCLDELARLVDAAVRSVRAGGRLHYVGAGTSGRLAVLDAAELAPTFGIDDRWVVAHHAGGVAALTAAVEGAEDDEAAGARELEPLAAADTVLGVAASGRTPYVAGALRRARATGATTALLTANPAAPLAALADLVIVTDTGAEAVTGSTRLKAATAHKLVLNSLSTALAVRLGRTYSNLMVDMRATNAKLRGRSVVMLEQATGCSATDCLVALDATGGEIRTSLFSLLTGCSVEEARARLADTSGNVRAALSP